MGLKPRQAIPGVATAETVFMAACRPTLISFYEINFTRFSLHRLVAQAYCDALLCLVDFYENYSKYLALHFLVTWYLMFT